MNVAGVRIIQNPLCETITVTWHVVRHPIRKRRRNWRVGRREKREPACWRLYDGTIVLHPTLYAQLRVAAKQEPAHEH